MDTLMGAFSARPDTGGVEFWHGAERTGWLMKQGVKEGRCGHVAEERAWKKKTGAGASHTLHTSNHPPRNRPGEFIKTWRRRYVVSGVAEGREQWRRGG